MSFNFASKEVAVAHPSVFKRFGDSLDFYVSVFGCFRCTKTYSVHVSDGSRILFLNLTTVGKTYTIMHTEKD